MKPLFIVKYDTIIGAYLGETAMRLKKLMDYVSGRKCVLFFDEFETLGKERGDLHETGEIKRVVSSLVRRSPSTSYISSLSSSAFWRKLQSNIIFLLAPPIVMRSQSPFPTG